MGLWDAVYSTADAVKQRLPDPQPVKNACRGAYGAIGSAVGSVRTVAPGVASYVAGPVRWSYNRGLDAACAVDRAVRVEGVKRIKGSVPDNETLRKFGWIAVDLTDLALDKYTRSLTGGFPAYKVAKDRLLKNDKKSADHAKTKELQRSAVDRAKVQELECRVERLECSMQGSCPQPYSHRRTVGVHQKPEDVLRVFMMKGFVGGDFIHDQVVGQHRNWERDVILIPAAPSSMDL